MNKITLAILLVLLMMLVGCGSAADSTRDEFKSGDVWNGLTYNTVTSPLTGKVWLDRNLGATQVCTAVDDTDCYGDNYQWGRLADGHEKKDPYLLTNKTLATDVTNVGHDELIYAYTWNKEDYGDWAYGTDTDGLQRERQWSKIDGTGICPIGFRVPTADEFAAEIKISDASNWNYYDSFDSFLKLGRNWFPSYNSQPAIKLWTSTPKEWYGGSAGRNFSIFENSGSSSIGHAMSAYPYPVRCIKGI